jgi:hypothetical protein
MSSPPHRQGIRDSRHRARHDPRGRVDRGERPRHAPHHRVVPAQSQPQPGLTREQIEQTCASTSASATFSGWETALKGRHRRAHRRPHAIRRPPHRRDVIVEDPRRPNYNAPRESRAPPHHEGPGRPAASCRHAADARPMHQDGQRCRLRTQTSISATGRSCCRTTIPAATTSRGDVAGAVSTRRVVPIDSVDLVWGLGACHCVTQQWPALIEHE